MRRDSLICLGLLILNLIAFWPVGQLGFIVLDDPAYVSDNPNVKGGITEESVNWAFTSLETGNWHPVTWLSHMVDYELFGLNASGHHWMNLAFHITNTLLLFIVFRRMTGQVWRCALVAALFAVHPQHLQSVAWISERKDVLSGFFFLLTLWAYVRYVQGTGSREQGGKTTNIQHPTSNIQHPTSNIQWYYWAAVFFFALGVMSKPMLVSLPLVLLLLDVWPLGRVAGGGWRVAGEKDSATGPSTFLSSIALARRRINQLLLEKWPFIALSLIACLATLRAQSGAGFIVHAAPLPWYVRVIIAPFFYLAYLKKMFWPTNLAIFYPYPLVPLLLIAAAGLLLIFISVLCLRQVRSRGYLLTGWFWFLVTLVPVIGLVQAGTQSIADRYTYLPSIGVFIIVAWGIGELAARSRFWQTGVTVGATAVVLACLADTRYQLRYWQNSVTLFTHALDVKRENNSMCYYCLGNALWETGDLDGAVTNYRTALQIAPDLTEASSRLGFILLQQNKPAEAEVEFREVLRVNPNDTKAHKYLGDILAAQGKLAEAEAEYATVLRLNPGNTMISAALQPDLDRLATAKALTNLYETLKVQPTAETHVQIAAIQTTQKEFKDAVEHYRAALRLKPDAPDILNNLAWLLATCPDDHVRDGAQAVQYAGRACELTQNQQPTMLGTLAAAYAEAGRFDEAAATAQKACDLATQKGETLLLQKNQALLELYRAHKPWRNERSQLNELRVVG